MAVPGDAKFMSLRHLGAVCGTLAGVGGLAHGVGEILQGSQPPDAMVFDSWDQGRIAENLGGEPAMTLVPNLLMTGILTIGASLALIVWSIRFLERQRAGRVVVLLSLLLLLVGGGFGPPVLGMFAGLVTGGAHVSRRKWRRRLSGGGGRSLAASWPGLFWVGVLNAVFLVVGSLVVGAAFDLAAPDLFVYSLFLVAVTMPLATLAGIADRVRFGSEDDAGAPAASAVRER
jgi:hypothetical protein